VRKSNSFGMFSSGTGVYSGFLITKTHRCSSRPQPCAFAIKLPSGEPGKEGAFIILHLYA
jgi:hypothetical protein